MNCRELFLPNAANIKIKYSATKDWKSNSPVLEIQPVITRGDQESPRTKKTTKKTIFFVFYYGNNALFVIIICNMLSLFSLSYSTQWSAKGINIMDRFLNILQ